MVLTVLYDSRCDFCCRVRHWLIRQPCYVELRAVAAGSQEARKLYPTLDHESTLGEITVVADNGAVYRGTKAFLMCLWALREYRETSLKLASPPFIGSTRRFFQWVTTRRDRL